MIDRYIDLEMKNEINKSNKGFTLVEVMVTTFLATVLFAGIYMTFVFGHKTSNHYSDYVQNRQQVRLALNWMVRELREAQQVFLVEEKDSLRLDFSKKKVGSISYIWSAEGEDKGILRRIGPVNSRILAREISAIFIDYPKVDTLLIEIVSAGRKEEDEIRLKGQVTLRSQMHTMHSWGRAYAQNE